MVLFCINRLHAQTGTAVSGKVLQLSGAPADFITASLLSAKDSSVLKGTLTNEKGSYLFTATAPGTYIVKVSGIGFKPAFSQLFTLDGKAPIVVAEIRLSPSVNELSAVSITATRPPVEHHGGKTIVNVENSVLAAGNTALEILGRAPGVTIDKDDNISLQGKTGVTVMIDGKITYLSGDQLSALLRSTDGSNVKSIELIPNPSASFDAAGTGGVINVKLKKNTKSGTSASVVLGTSYTQHPGDNTSVTVNHKDGKLNLYGNISRSDNPSDSYIRIKRNVDSAGTKTFFNQEGKTYNVRHSNSFRVGADYDLSPGNTLGLNINGYTNPRQKNEDTRTDIGTQPGVTDSYENTATRAGFSSRNIAANVNDRIKFDTTGKELAIDLDYSKFNNNTDALYNTDYFSPSNQQIGMPQVLNNLTPSTIVIHTAKFDYTYPVNRHFKLQTGMKYSSVQTNNVLNANVLTNGAFVNDTTKTNQFLYNEKISAAYADLSQHYANTSFEYGLRAEYTSSSGDLTTRNSVVKRHYLDFFPNLTINQTLDEKDELSFNYSRRTNRPGYAELNPFIYYVDEYTYIQGNSFLNPEYSNNFQLNYTYNKLINVGFGYQRTDHVISDVFLTDTLKKATVITSLNLNNYQSYTLNVNFPYTLTSWWTGNMDLNGIYGKTMAGGISGYLDKGQLTFQGKTTQSFRIGKTYNAELMTSYSSQDESGYYLIKPMFGTDAGINHSLFNKTASIKFAVSNIFNANYHIISNAQGNIIDTQLRPASRTMHLTFTYSIGNRKVSGHQHQNGAADEEKRVGSVN